MGDGRGFKDQWGRGAKFETKIAAVRSGYGESMAKRWFNEETIAALPRVTRGKTKGAIQWAVQVIVIRCLEGGYIYSSVRPLGMGHESLDRFLCNQYGLEHGKVCRIRGAVVAKVLYDFDHKQVLAFA